MPYRAQKLTDAPAAPRPRRTWLAAVTVTAVFAGSGVAVAMLRAGEPPPAPQARPAPLPWPSQAHAWEVHRADGNTRQVLFGLLRFTLGPGGTSVATTHFDDALVAAVPVTRGWVFVAADGTVASSETFLGVPRPVGRVAGAFRVASTSVGRAVIMGEDGSLWTTDGDSNGLVRHRLPADVRDATFVDAARGVAVLRDGRVMATDTAGQRWERVDLGLDVGWAVSPGVDGALVETTGGPWSYRWGTGLGAPRAVGRRLDRAQLPRAEEDQLRPYINRRYERFESAGPSVRVQRSGAGPDDLARVSPRRYVCQSDREVPPLTVLPTVRGRRVYARDLLSGTDAGPVRAMFWRPVPDTAQETLVRVAWRGADERGAFTAATSPSGRGLGLHSPVDDRGPLQVVAFSRRGALVRTSEANREVVLAWGSPDRPFVRVRDPFVEQDHGSVFVFTTPPDGGVTVVWGRLLHNATQETWSRGYIDRTAQVGIAMHVDPTGAVRARRGFVGDDPWQRTIAWTDGSIGPLVHDTDEPQRWRLIPMDGSAPKVLPTLRWADVPACDGPGVAGAGLTAGLPPVMLQRSDGQGTIEVATQAELNLLSDGRVCIRALSLSGRRLTAIPGDGFDGAIQCRAAQ